MVELKDKVLPKGTVDISTSSGVPSVPLGTVEFEGSQELVSYTDAVSALATLGYKATDADLAVRRAAEALGKECTTEELIRKALGR